jgi:hypothetical protein
MSAYPIVELSTDAPLTTARSVQYERYATMEDSA